MNEIKHPFFETSFIFSLADTPSTHTGFGFDLDLRECADAKRLPKRNGDYTMLTYLSGFDFATGEAGEALLFGIGGNVAARTDPRTSGSPPFEYQGGCALLLRAGKMVHTRNILNFLGLHCITEGDIILRRSDSGHLDITLAICQVCNHGIRFPEAAVRAKTCPSCMYNEWQRPFLPKQRAKKK